MRRMRHGVGVGVAVVGMLAAGCQSTPSAPVSATPLRPFARATPTTPPARTAQNSAALPTEAGAGPSPSAAEPVRRADPIAPSVPALPTAPPVASRPAPAPATNGGATGAAPYAAIPTAQPAAPRPPRSFRTPERAGDQAFVPPQADEPGGDTSTAADSATAPAAAGRRPSSGVVIFRATARTALEGFDVRVTYPASLGRFAATDNLADCTGAAGAIVTASDRGTGELRLLVASAQALALPFDVFCRFTAAGGARLTAADFATRVAEVVSEGKKSDPALLLVDVVVR